MGRLARAFGKAAKRTINIALGSAEVVASEVLIFGGPAVGIGLFFAGFVCPILWVGAYAAFAGGVTGGIVLGADGMSRLQR